MSVAPTRPHNSDLASYPVSPAPAPSSSSRPEVPSSLHILHEVMLTTTPDGGNGTQPEGYFRPEERDALAKVTTAKPTIIIYPTIAPETVIIPILCSIVVFPIVVATLICLLRHYNRRARAKDKFSHRSSSRLVGDTTGPEDADYYGYDEYYEDVIVDNDEEEALELVPNGGMVAPDQMLMKELHSTLSPPCQSSNGSIYQQGATAIFSVTKMGTDRIGRGADDDSDSPKRKDPTEAAKAALNQFMPDLELVPEGNEDDDDDEDDDDEEDEESSGNNNKSVSDIEKAPDPLKKQSSVVVVAPNSSSFRADSPPKVVIETPPVTSSGCSSESKRRSSSSRLPQRAHTLNLSSTSNGAVSQASSQRSNKRKRLTRSVTIWDPDLERAVPVSPRPSSPRADNPEERRSERRRRNRRAKLHRARTVVDDDVEVDSDAVKKRVSRSATVSAPVDVVSPVVECHSVKRDTVLHLEEEEGGAAEEEESAERLHVRARPRASPGGASLTKEVQTPISDLPKDFVRLQESRPWLSSSSSPRWAAAFVAATRMAGGS